jgi:hypothetical protein
MWGIFVCFQALTLIVLKKAAVNSWFPGIGIQIFRERWRKTGYFLCFITVRYDKTFLCALWWTGLLVWPSRRDMYYLMKSFASLTVLVPTLLRCDGQCIHDPCLDSCVVISASSLNLINRHICIICQMYITHAVIVFENVATNSLSQLSQFLIGHLMTYFYRVSPHSLNRFRLNLPKCPCFVIFTHTNFCTAPVVTISLWTCITTSSHLDILIILHYLGSASQIILY